MVDIKGGRPAGTGHRDPVEQNIGNRRLWYGPEYPGALGPAGGGGGDVLEGDIFPIRGGAGGGCGCVG